MVILMSKLETSQIKVMPKANNKWITLIVICLGQIMVSINASSINLATPILTEVFSVDLNQIQWVITIYFLVTSSIMLLLGRIGDRIGSHKLFISGFLIFTIASLLCGISGSFVMLLFARVVQALGASMIQATGVGILVTAFPENQRGKAIGIQAIAIGMGYMCGPSIGGIILDSLGWHYIFFSNIPLAVIGFLGGLRFLRSPIPEDKSALPRLDSLGALLLAVIICSLIMAVSGGFAGSVWFLLIIVPVLPYFVLHERRHPSPLWDLSLLKNKRFALGNVIVFLIFSTHFSLLFHLPLYMKNILELPATTIGLVMLGSPAVMAIVSPLSGQISDKKGPLRVMPVAILIILASHISLAFLRADSSIWYVLISTLVLGIGVGGITTPTDSAVMASAGPKNAGYASGFLNTTRNLAICIGTAISAGAFTMLRNSFERSLEATVAYMNAFRIVFLAISLITCINFCICLWLRRYNDK